jgi:hypothetical protein
LPSTWASCFDGVGVPWTAFVEDRRCGGAETVRGHFIFRVTEAAQGGVERIFGERSATSARSRQNQISLAGIRTQVLEGGNRLSCEGNAMRSAHLHAHQGSSKRPCRGRSRPIVRPAARRAGQKLGQAIGGPNEPRHTVMAVDRAQQSAELSRIDDRRAGANRWRD